MSANISEVLSVVGTKHLHVSFDFILTTDRLREEVRVTECKSEGAQLTVSGEPGTPAIVSRRHTLMRALLASGLARLLPRRRTMGSHLSQLTASARRLSCGIDLFLFFSQQVV